MSLQSLLIRWILNPLGGAMEKVPRKYCTAGFYLGGAVLFFIYFFNAMEIISVRYLLFFVPGCLALGLMLLCTLPGKFHPLRFSPLLSVCWFGAGLMMLQAGLRLNTDIFSDALMFLVAWPVLWLIWGQSDLPEIFRMLCQLCRGAFVVYFAVSFLFFPISSAQYPGMFHNVNNSAFFYTLVLACLTVELWQRERRDAAFWRDLVLLGLAGAMMFYTNSRTGELAILCGWLFGGILYLWSHRDSLKDVLVKRLLPMVLSLLILIPATVYLFIAVMPISRTLSHEVHTTIAGMIAAPGTDDKAEQNAPSNEPSEDTPNGLSEFVEKTEQKGSTSGKGLDKYSTGRLSIWQAFAANTRLFGTEPPHSYYVAINDVYYGTAHSTPLEYAINSGWICGILYLLFNILAGLKSLRYVLLHWDKPYALLPFVVTIAFGVCSMLASMNTPYLYMLTMYYFFVQTPLMASQPDEKRFTAVEEKGASV